MTVTVDGPYTFTWVDDDGDYVELDTLEGTIEVGDSTDPEDRTYHKCNWGAATAKQLRAWLDGAIAQMEEQELR